MEHGPDNVFGVLQHGSNVIVGEFRLVVVDDDLATFATSLAGFGSGFPLVVVLLQILVHGESQGTGIRHVRRISGKIECRIPKRGGSKGWIAGWTILFVFGLVVSKGNIEIKVLFLFLVVVEWSLGNGRVGGQCTLVQNGGPAGLL